MTAVTRIPEPSVESELFLDAGSATRGFLGDPPATTRPASSLITRFGVAILPFAAAAALAVPAPRERILATYSRGSRSGTALLDVVWLLDDWSYSEEPAAIEQVRMLNALLALDAPEGFALDLPD